MTQKTRSLSVIDKKILNRLQRDLPFAEKPWKVMARELKIDEARLLRRISVLKKKGLIRRISATFDPRKVGFVSTLVAARVSEKHLDKAAKKISGYDEVTHNYKRDTAYNLWFTLVASSKSRIEKVLREIRKIKEVEQVLNLPAERLFKIGVKFKV